MLYFVLGTKAQFIKMAPVIREATSRGTPWRLVDLGQHADITERILEDFGLPRNSHPLFPGQRSVSDYWAASRWLGRFLLQVIRPSAYCRRVFNEPGIVLIHGDTLSTLTGALLAKRLGLKIGLVEAGLTSGNLWSPFPEEIIRRLCERLACLLFAPGQEAARRLKEVRNGMVIDTKYNTGRDSLVMQLGTAPAPQNDYGLVTLHRLETLKSRRRFARAIGYIEELAQSMSIVFVIHPPTLKAITSKGMLAQLQNNKNIELCDLLPYPEFLTKLTRARVVFTDGGSVQEECSYLKKPCIILRDVTERNHGIGESATLTSWSPHDDLDKALTLPAGIEVMENQNYDASRLIVDSLLRFN